MSSGLQVYVDMAAEALRDGTDLFGRPLPPGAGGLADQAVLIEQLAQKMAADDPQDLGLSGVTVEQWREHAQANARAVAAAAATDKQVAVHLDESGQVVADGSSAMDANNQAAQQNTAAIAPFTNTPAGTRQMLRELDNRLGTGKQVISAADQRSAQLAQLLRATRMPAGMGAGMGGGMGSGMGGGGFGGMSPAGMGGSGGGGFSFPNLTGLTGQHRGASASGSPATVAGGPAVFQNLDEQQMSNARKIVNEGLRLGLPPEAQQIALMTALTESGIRRLANSSVPGSELIPNDGIGHDHDSTGPFQQRQSWGPTAELMDPTLSANKFYTQLMKVAGWQHMTKAQAAQAVQRSAFPDAYAKYEQQAASLLNVLTRSA